MRGSAINREGKYMCGEPSPFEGRRPGRRAGILLVEDEWDLLNVTASVLEENGYAVFTASDAEEAVEIFEMKRDRIDLLFSDINLPGLSGIQLAEQLKAEEPGLKVMLMSGNPYMEGMVLNYKFMGKPYRFLDMLEGVRAALE